jgi:hypothetical protein
MRLFRLEAERLLSLMSMPVAEHEPGSGRYSGADPPAPALGIGTTLMAIAASAL